MADKDQDKKRLSGKIRIYLAVLAGGAAYLIWVRLTGLGIPCPIRLITGWKCPGCGITTLFVRLAQGDIAGAYEANSFLLMTFPFLIVELIWAEYSSSRKVTVSKWAEGINIVAGIIYLVALIAFGVFRNICPSLF
ncbi:MAG: DUF2752 domain-containing protein [Clostridiales bacterium]|nr:DUF2752 domain-containing protein [Clostridiales bacterium]MBR6484693.1 DUF2752 domain-containing protein [Clostridiales bacterium]